MPFRWSWVALAAAFTACGPAAAAPLHDAVSLNIGLSCQWQKRCMQAQKRAMKQALSYVKKQRPATWRVEQCNRNAARGRYRVDWLGFNNCIRNAALRYTPPPAPPRKRRSRRRSEA